MCKRIKDHYAGLKSVDPYLEFLTKAPVIVPETAPDIAADTKLLVGTIMADDLPPETDIKPELKEAMNQPLDLNFIKTDANDDVIPVLFINTTSTWSDDLADIRRLQFALILKNTKFKAEGEGVDPKQMETAAISLEMAEMVLSCFKKIGGKDYETYVDELAKRKAGSTDTWVEEKPSDTLDKAFKPKTTFEKGWIAHWATVAGYLQAIDTAGGDPAKVLEAKKKLLTAAGQKK
jgi:hypothetical protein